MKKHIVVIGGGIAGTAAAYTLVGLGYKVTVVEKNERLGGRVLTRMVRGQAVEMGAGFLTTAYSHVNSFLGANDLSRQLINPRSTAAIVRNAVVQPASLATITGSSVLSWSAKWQALPILAETLSHWQQIDLHKPWLLKHFDDRVVADRAHSTGGREFLEYVLEPILNGYFYWNPESTSEAMLLIIAKTLLMSRTRKLSGGLQQIPERATIGSQVLLRSEALAVKSKQDSSFEVTLKSSNKIHTLLADGVVCAVPASAVSSLVPHLNNDQRHFFNSVRYAPTVVMAATYLQKRILSNRSIAFPRLERSKLSAMTLSTDSAADGAIYSTLKVYASGSLDRGFYRQSDDEIVKILAKESAAVLQAIQFDASRQVSLELQRWPEAIPLMNVGYLRQLGAFMNGSFEKSSQALVYAGDYIGLPCLEGAFTSGKQAAERLDHLLQVY